MERLYKSMSAILGSSKFFIAVLVIFLAQSIYIAVSAAYPMVFDENTHFGIIQLHANQLSPIFTHQPPNAEFAGALTRDPSYLFRYILSFPYRLIIHISDSQMIQIIFLRFFNIAFFGAGLILFRKLLLKTRASRAIVHTVLLFFVLIPVVPLLAGQINYDNLLFPISAALLLLTVKITDSVRKKSLPLNSSLLYMTVGMLGCLVQFAFLPIFAGTFLWLAWQVRDAARRKGLNPIRALQKSWSAQTWTRRLIYIAPFVISAGLFLQMYLVNVVGYHNLVPQCHQVLSEKDCALNGAWQRNHEARLNNDGSSNTNPVLYAGGWAYRMFVSSFYTSSGGAGPSAWYLSINPLPVPFFAAIFVFLIGAVLVLWYNTKLLRNYNHLGLLLFIGLFYCLALWLRNYQDFVHLGEKVAINGRYILPVLPPMMLIIALAYRKLLARHHNIMLGALLCGALLFTQGGGATTYVVSSQPSWYWQNNRIVQFNGQLKRVVTPLVIFKGPVGDIGQ